MARNWAKPVPIPRADAKPEVYEIRVRELEVCRDGGGISVNVKDRYVPDMDKIRRLAAAEGGSARRWSTPEEEAEARLMVARLELADAGMDLDNI